MRQHDAAPTCTDRLLPPLQEYYNNVERPAEAPAGRITPKEALDAMPCFITGLSQVPMAFVRVKAKGAAGARPGPGSRVVPCFRPVAKAFEFTLPTEYDGKWLEEVLKRQASAEAPTPVARAAAPAAPPTQLRGLIRKGSDHAHSSLSRMAEFKRRRAEPAASSKGGYNRV